MRSRVLAVLWFAIVALGLVLFIRYAGDAPGSDEGRVTIERQEAPTAAPDTTAASRYSPPVERTVSIPGVHAETLPNTQSGYPSRAGFTGQDDREKAGRMSGGSSR